MKTSSAFIARQCDQAGEVTELDECIASGQVSAAQIEAHRVAGDFVKQGQPNAVDGERELFHAAMERFWPGIDMSLRDDGTYWDHRDDEWQLWQAARALPLAPAALAANREGV